MVWLGCLFSAYFTQKIDLLNKKGNKLFGIWGILCHFVSQGNSDMTDFIYKLYQVFNIYILKNKFYSFINDM